MALLTPDDLRDINKQLQEADSIVRRVTGLGIKGICKPSTAPLRILKNRYRACNRRKRHNKNFSASCMQLRSTSDLTVLLRICRMSAAIMKPFKAEPILS